MSRIRACDVCYRRKIQCIIPTAGDPCNWCSHHHLACTFLRGAQAQKKKKLKQNDIEGLFDRVEQLETALSRSNPHHQYFRQGNHLSSEQPITTGSEHHQSRGTSLTNPDCNITASSPHIPDAITTYSSSLFSQDVFARSQLGLNWYFKGTPALSDAGLKWISSKTGEDVTLEKFHVFRGSPSFHPSLHQVYIHRDDQLQLPYKSAVQNIIDAFYNSPVRFVFPIDEVIFKQTMETAYEPLGSLPASNLHISARASVFAALAMMSRFEELKEVQLSLDGDICAAKAQSLLSRIPSDGSLATLQAVLMLQKYRVSVGHWETAISLHAVACRMLYGLGGHIYQPPKSSGNAYSVVIRQSNLIRTLFWLCYMSDKDISLRSGHPPLLNEDYCDLTPPDDYAIYYRHSLEGEREAGIGDFLDDWNPIIHLPGDPLLGHVKEKAFRLLYSPRAFKITDSELLLRIRHLDDELESWRESIPSSFRPKLSILSTSALLTGGIMSPRMRRCIDLQLEYHYTLTFIHSTVRRCGAASAAAGDVPEDLHSVLHSSTDLSLEASRSTLSLLAASVNSWAGEAFCRTIFFLAVAAMSLFMNVLIHPIDEQADADLHRLDSTIDLLRGLHIQSQSPGVDDNKHAIVELLTELVRLGTCAISKAKTLEYSG
ncbi:hypothetical protein BX600DRAFT_56137 [Xylariales sp. PMI_506]|nr:hypothetical protein BX600DRAFT_56137 [Xylariales sp. PMI_506]